MQLRKANACVYLKYDAERDFTTASNRGEPSQRKAHEAGFNNSTSLVKCQQYYATSPQKKFFDAKALGIRNSWRKEPDGRKKILKHIYSLICRVAEHSTCAYYEERRCGKSKDRCFIYVKYAEVSLIMHLINTASNLAPRTSLFVRYSEGG